MRTTERTEEPQGAGPRCLLWKSFRARDRPRLSPEQIHHPSPQEGVPVARSGHGGTGLSRAQTPQPPPRSSAPRLAGHRAPRAARPRPGAQGGGRSHVGPVTRASGAGRPPPYLLLAVVDAHPALLDHQRLVDLQEAAGPHEAVHGRLRAGLCRSPELRSCERRPLVAGGGGAAGSERSSSPTPRLSMGGVG